MYWCGRVCGYICTSGVKFNVKYDLFCTDMVKFKYVLVGKGLWLGMYWWVEFRVT